MIILFLKPHFKVSPGRNVAFSPRKCVEWFRRIFLPPVSMITCFLVLNKLRGCFKLNFLRAPRIYVIRRKSSKPSSRSNRQVWSWEKRLLPLSPRLSNSPLIRQVGERQSNMFDALPPGNQASPLRSPSLFKPQCAYIDRSTWPVAGWNSDSWDM